MNPTRPVTAYAQPLPCPIWPERLGPSSPCVLALWGLPLLLATWVYLHVLGVCSALLLGPGVMECIVMDSDWTKFPATSPPVRPCLHVVLVLHSSFPLNMLQQECTVHCCGGPGWLRLLRGSRRNTQTTTTTNKQASNQAHNLAGQLENSGRSITTTQTTGTDRNDSSKSAL